MGKVFILTDGKLLVAMSCPLRKSLSSNSAPMDIIKTRLMEISYTTQPNTSVLLKLPGVKTLEIVIYCWELPIVTHIIMITPQQQME